MQIDILSLFPEIFKGVFETSIIGRAQKKKVLKVKVHDFRSETSDRHRTVDDRPFGGGAGMILKVEPIYKALKKLKKTNPGSKVILLSPQGKRFDQKTAKSLTRHKHLILVCGHYEGVDERVANFLVDEQISIGDYILTGGEIPAMVLVDAITRLIPGVLLQKEATADESFQAVVPLHPEPGQPPQRLESPQYTRPAVFKGISVPKILLSGHHDKIRQWRLKEALKRTRQLRPDLLKGI